MSALGGPAAGPPEAKTRVKRCWWSTQWTTGDSGGEGRSDAFPLGPVGPIITHARTVAIGDDDGIARPSHIADSTVLRKAELIPAAADDDSLVSAFQIRFLAAEIF